jgi:hypothetical protein
MNESYYKNKPLRFSSCKKMDEFIIDKQIQFTLSDTGFCRALHHLIQEYRIADTDQKVVIRDKLESGIQLILSYVMPIDFKKLNFSLLPSEVMGDMLTIDKRVSYLEGDLQIALLLLKVSKLFKNEKLQFLSNIIGTVSEYKEKVNKNEFISCDFENGTIGIALVYQTMFLLNNAKFYNKQANYWYEISKKIFDANPVINAETTRAFYAFEHPQNDAWRRSFFLEFDLDILSSC